MSIFEYDKEEEERKLRKAEYEAGVAAGFSDGFNNGFDNGFNNGIDTAKKMPLLLLQNFMFQLSKLPRHCK